MTRVRIGLGVPSLITFVNLTVNAKMLIDDGLIGEAKIWFAIAGLALALLMFSTFPFDREYVATPERIAAAYFCLTRGQFVALQVTICIMLAVVCSGSNWLYLANDEPRDLWRFVHFVLIPYIGFRYGYDVVLDKYYLPTP